MPQRVKNSERSRPATREASTATRTYSAVPVDRLGNRGAEAAAGEIRVAWDKTIDPSLYTAVWEDGSLVITMRDGAAG